MTDYYLILGVEPNDTTQVIKKAYKLMSQKYHPDKNQGDKYFEERFKDIYEAYDVLSNTEKRKAYDYQRLSYYKNDNKDNWTTEDKNDYKTREEKLKVREENIQKKEKEVTDKETQLTNQFQALIRERDNANSRNHSKNLILFFTIAIALGAIIFSFIKADDAMNNVYRDKILSIEEELRNSKVQNGNLVLTKDSLLSDLKFLTNHAENQNKKVEELSKEVQNSKSAKKNTQNSVLREEGLSLPNRVILRNTSSVELLNLRWDNYDLTGEERIIQRISVFNKTDKPITSITVSYEVKNSKGQAINSGDFVINPPIFYSGEKSFMDKIEPKKAKEFYVSGHELPTKRSTDLLILTIKVFEFEE